MKKSKIIPLVLALFPVATMLLASDTIAAMPDMSTNISSGGYGHADDGVDFSVLLGNQVYFGNYDHVVAFPNAIAQFSATTSGAPSYEGVRRPILWKVMGEENGDGQLVLASKYILDGKQFSNKSGTLSNTDYTTSTLRAFLNGDFINSSFSTQESEMLATSQVTVDGYKYINDGNPVVGDGYPKTVFDKVYLPSARENWAATDTLNSLYDGIVVNEVNINLKILRNGADKGLHLDKTLPEIAPSGLINENSFSTWIRVSCTDNTTHAKNEHTITTSGNTPTSIHGIMPIVKINPHGIVYISQISQSPNSGQTSVDENYGATANPAFDLAYLLEFYRGISEESTFNWLGEEMDYERIVAKVNAEEGIRNYKLTILSPYVKLQGVSYNGISLTNGDSISVPKGGTLLLNGSGDNYDKFVYKIVRDGEKREIVAYGAGDAQTLTIETGQLPDDEDYTLYVWAQNDEHINSNEGSDPMFFRFHIGTSSSTVVLPAKIIAKPTSTNFMLDNAQIDLPAYEIGGNNYVKLRDVAALLVDRFDVRWEDKKAKLYNHSKYTVTGGELAAIDADGKTAVLSQTGFVWGDTGKAVTGLTAYSIGDNNFIRLRDIAKLFDFDVDWRDGKAWIEPDESPYTED